MPRTIKGWIVIGIPSIFALLGVMFTVWSDLEIERLNEEHEIKMWEMENAYEQHFYNNSCIVKKSGIEYIQYKITSEPVVAGYHMIVCPYLVCDIKSQKKYIPITGQFTQEEYAADENGCCILFRENTSEELLDMVDGLAAGFPVEIRCLAAIQYVEEEQEKREVYDVRDGQLIKADQGLAVAVLNEWGDEKSMKLDMWSWPCIDQQRLEEIFGFATTSNIFSKGIHYMREAVIYIDRRMKTNFKFSVTVQTTCKKIC